MKKLGIDAIVLVDGGTDILMRGDEHGLGSPEEDMASLAAVAGTDGVERLVACLGFGICSSTRLWRYFTVDLPALAHRVGCLDRLADTEDMFQISLAIEEHHEEVSRRPWRAFPH